jgi:hypothetical protein
MIIKITDQAKEEARIYAEAIKGRGISDIGNYTNISVNDRFYIGYLGEWAFNQFLILKDFKSKVTWSREADGMADSGDFFFDNKIIDIKTASQHYYKNIMTPLAQFEKHKRDYYVAVKLNQIESTAEIVGYVNYDELKKAPISDFGHGATKAILFKDVHNINELLQQHILKNWEVN